MAAYGISLAMLPHHSFLHRRSLVVDSTDGSVSGSDNNDVIDRESPNIGGDDNSCCSDDTVLSVGNENENTPPSEDKPLEDVENAILNFKNFEKRLKNSECNKIGKSTFRNSLENVATSSYRFKTNKNDLESPILSFKNLGNHLKSPDTIETVTSSFKSQLESVATSSLTFRNIGKPPESTESSTLSFKNIENHLNALQQITNSTLNPQISDSKLVSSSPRLISPASSTGSQRSKSFGESPPPVGFLFRTAGICGEGSGVCSPRSVSEPESPGSPSPRLNHRDLHSSYHRTHQNQVGDATNNGSLKFSIDNILKADFGRSRITDPLSIRKSKPPPRKPSISISESSNSGIDEPIKQSSTGPVDLSKNDGSQSDTSTTSNKNAGGEKGANGQPMMWPAWVYCTRYSDRPSSGPRTRRPKKPSGAKPAGIPEEKRPRTAFSGAQLARLKHEFAENRYLTERRRQQLSAELGLNEAQIKIWFQNKRAKIKKASGQKNPLALQLMAQGLYNHSTIPLSKEEEELEQMQQAGQS